VIKFQHVVSVVQKIVNSIRARPLQHRLFKHLLDEIDAHYGDLISHTEVRWLNTGKLLFRFQELLPAILEFILDKSDLSPQLDDSRWLLDLAFITDFTAKLNDMNTQLQGENKTIVKMIGTFDSVKGNLKLWRTQLIKSVLTHFPSVQSCADGTFDASVYSLCIDKLLKAFERRFNPFQERDLSESTELTSTVFKGNVSDLERELINFQTDLSLKTRSNGTNFWSLLPSA